MAVCGKRRLPSKRLEWHPGGNKINNKIHEIQPTVWQVWNMDTRTDTQRDT